MYSRLSIKSKLLLSGTYSDTLFNLNSENSSANADTKPVSSYLNDIFVQKMSCNVISLSASKVQDSVTVFSKPYSRGNLIILISGLMLDLISGLMLGTSLMFYLVPLPCTVRGMCTYCIIIE